MRSRFYKAPAQSGVSRMSAPATAAAGTATVTNNANMYRVGDYVYFENSASGPFAIRRIEELNKTTNGE